MATGLAKTICATTQTDSILEFALIRIDHNHFRITSTNDASSLDVRIPLLNPLPELEDDPICFLINISSFFELTKEESGDVVSLSVNDHTHSLTYKVQTSELVLPIRRATEWPNIDSRFDITAQSFKEITKSNFVRMLTYNKHFLPHGQDANMYLVEIRNGLALSSDRKRFGFYLSDEFNDLKLRLPGDQISPLEKAVEFFPPGNFSIATSDTENLLVINNPNIAVALTFLKSCLTLPVSLDKVPMVEEDNRIELNTAFISKSLARLSIVCAKTDPKLKLEFHNDSMKLATVNDLGHESVDTLLCQRLNGDRKTIISIPLSVLRKIIKLVDSETCILGIGKDSSYLKISVETDEYETHSIIQAS